jgi:predicted O-methyltransferase YrrM
MNLFQDARSKTNVKATLAAFAKLENDPIWTERVIANIESGAADIRALLFYLAKKTKPAAYLEIGVRRGFSMAMVAAGNPACNLYGFDAWIPNYARVDNPGPAFVASEIAKFNRSGGLTFVDGNSRETLPRFFADNPDLQPDLILIDGDHSPEGATADLTLCLPRLAPGGCLVFDDLTGSLEGVWGEAIRRYGDSYIFERDGLVGVIHHGD